LVNVGWGVAEDAERKLGGKAEAMPHELQAGLLYENLVILF
jgi:hypothetical protein